MNKAIGGLLIALPLLGMAPAHADTISFYSDVSNEGVPGQPLTLMSQGTDVCHTLRTTHSVALAGAPLGHAGYSMDEATIIIQAAITNLCPDQSWVYSTHA